VDLMKVSLPFLFFAFLKQMEKDPLQKEREELLYEVLKCVVCEKILVIHIFGGFPQSQSLSCGVTFGYNEWQHSVLHLCRLLQTLLCVQHDPNPGPWCHRDSVAFAMDMLRLHLLNRYLLSCGNLSPHNVGYYANSFLLTVLIELCSSMSTDSRRLCVG
jgi:hypothetical protein